MHLKFKNFRLIFFKLLIILKKKSENEIIFEEGSNGANMYLILSGTL